MRRLLTGFLFFAGALAAQGIPNLPQFVDVTPDFTGVALSRNGQTAWASATNGFVYRSADGGSTWTPTDVPGDGELRGIYFHADEVRGWVVGESRIALTTDGGETWRKVPKAPKGKLRKILFDSGGKRGFAIGDVVLETEDGGLTWKERNDPELKASFQAVAFSPSWEYGVMGGNTGLMETRDGGRTWKRGPDRPVSPAKLWTDGETAIAMEVASEGYWIRPSGSQTWTPAWDPRTGKPKQSFPSDVTTAIGERGLRFDSGGKPLKQVMEGNFFDIAFAPQPKFSLTPNGRVGLAVGRAGLVARTENLGESWRVVNRWPEFDHLTKVVLRPHSDRIWVCGGELWRSSDQGRSFQQLAIPNLASGFHLYYTGAKVLDMLFSPDGRTGWIATGGGAILKSTDGGENWTPGHIENSRGDEIAMLTFAGDKRRGLAIGLKGMFATQDAGNTWVPRESAPISGPALTTVYWIPGGNVVVAAGLRGRIWRSEDEGETWKQISSGTLADFRQVIFREDGRVGWITGDAVSKPNHPATILRTENGGRSWTAARIPAENVTEINSIWFNPTGQFGWAAANIQDKGRLLRSTDSGKSWELMEPEDRYYTGLTLTADGKRGWATSPRHLLSTARQVQAPVIRNFSINSADYRLELSAYDTDTPPENVAGTIEVESDGFPMLEENRRRSFTLADADLVEWPKNAFARGENYKFHLRLSDGWNIVTSDYELRAGAPRIPETSSVPSAGLDVSELQGVDLAGAKILLDGRPVESSQLINRGTNGRVTLMPSASAMHELPDGFHVLSVARGASQDMVRRIGFYKEQLTLKLLHTVGRSYALIIAIGDYPAQSGYSKLPSAVPQARELEKTLRAQGFIVLPLLVDGNATRDRIEGAIRSIPAGPDDKLLLYFGGHGDDEKGFQGKPIGYLIPYDGSKSDLWSTAIPLEKISGEYSSRLRAKHVLFALDSCQSGLAIARGNALELSADELRRFKALAEIETLSAEPGRTILTAGTGGQDALDISGGIFTAALTDAIKGKADADHNGVVDYYELFAYVWGRVNSEARQWVRKQQPADYHLGNGRWVFIYQ